MLESIRLFLILKGMRIKCQISRDLLSNIKICRFRSTIPSPRQPSSSRPPWTTKAKGRGAFLAHFFLVLSVVTPCLVVTPRASSSSCPHRTAPPRPSSTSHTSSASLGLDHVDSCVDEEQEHGGALPQAVLDNHVRSALPVE